MLCSYTCVIDPLLFEMAQNVVESVDNITTRSLETLQPVETTEYKQEFMDI